MQICGVNQKVNEIDQIHRIFRDGTVDFYLLSRVLQELNLVEISESINRRKSNYEVQSLLKLYIFKKVKEIKSYSKLKEEVVEENLRNLGLTNVPTKQNYNHFFRTKVSESILNKLDEISLAIPQIAIQNKKVMDIDLIEPKKKRNYKNKAREERKLLTKTSKILKKLVYPLIDIEIAKHSRFTKNDLLDILVHIAQTHDFANNGCVTFKDLYEEKDVPNGDTFLYHLHKIDDIVEVIVTFKKISDALFLLNNRYLKSLNKRKLCIAFDIHQIPFYGDVNTPYIKEGKMKNGTSKFYQFLTCDIVEAGRRFTIDVIPIHRLDLMKKLVNESLERVKRKFRIEMAFLDRAFSNSKIIPIFRKYGIDYVMPIIRNDKVANWMNKSEACNARAIKNYKIKGVPTNLYIVKIKDKGIYPFVTNKDIPEQMAHYLYIWYRKRWGIETGYRLKAQDFRARTCSKSPGLRIFYFMFSTLIYNLWVFTNIVIGFSLYNKIPKKPIITAKRYVLFLYKTVFEDPPDFK